MSNPPLTTDVARDNNPRRSRPKSGRYFYSVAAVIMFTLMLAGFHPFYLRGEGMGARKISPQLLTLVVMHGSAMTAWVILFMVQSLLIPARKLRVHMKLGWVAVAAAIVVTVSGFMIAIQSVRQVPTLPFWGMAYRQFLMVMLAEVSLFTAFVVAGVLSRKKPKIHRSMMLLATLSILAGATVRMPVLFPIFGEGDWSGIFGPIFTLGGVFLLARSVVGRFDRWFAAGYALMIVFYIAACKFAVSDAWGHIAQAIFKT
jgi:hypothetical protein